MTILPKKKQTSNQQQQQQDSRHQQHGASGNIGAGNRNIDDSSGISGAGIVNTSGNNVGISTTAAANVSNSAAIQSFTPTTGSITALSSSNYGGDVLASGGISSGTLTSNTGGIRRSHFGCHENSDGGDGVSVGPHRKRTATAAASNSGTTGNNRAGQNERSSPYRTTRRSHRSAGASANVRSNSPSVVGATSTANNAAAIPTSGTVARNNQSTPDEEGGYNSEDEYSYQSNVTEEMERKFEEQLMSAKGLRIKKMKEDGACLFRAVADQVYGDEEMHGVVRKLCMDYMAKNVDYFNQFITEDFASYIERKRQDSAHGNQVEMQAMAELFNRPIQVYQYSGEPINTFHTAQQTDNPAIRVSYHGNVHYNSVVDPYAATVGVGLGLPQFYPGLAEKNLMRDAVHASEKHAIEDAMLEDKLRATDWEATDEQLQEQVARESYLQWLRDQEKQMKEIAATRDGVSTTTTNAITSDMFSLDSFRPSCSKTPSRSHHAQSDVAGASIAGSSRIYGTKQWNDDDEILKQVLALSQQEYFDSLKKDPENKKSPPHQHSPS